MGNRDYFQDEVERLKTAINSAVLNMEAKDRADWLKTMYNAFSNRMLSDNERIWRTGAILIPLSLSAFAALVSIKDLQPWRVLVLGLASSALLWCWLIIAENHRAFQQKSDAWMVAIQEIIGIQNVGGPKVRGNVLNQMLIFSGAVQGMRWVLAVGVTGAWLFLWWLAYSGRLT